MTLHVDHFKDAVDKGFFDADWYMKSYGLFFSDPRDAFADYLRKSRHSWIDPSPYFSTKSYFLAHGSEIEQSGSSPLEHFLSSDYHSNSAQHHHRPTWHPPSYLTPPSEFRGSLRCAITAHIFYADSLISLSECLVGLPLCSDVLLTVSSADIKDDADKLIGSIQGINNVIIRVVPNRGRNFGPLLVEYGSLLLNYDLFCHVHSKKSLFSGSPQQNWADYQFEYLLRDKQIVCKALSILESRDDLGIYFPAAYSRSLPKWASHTLKNRQSMNDLAVTLALPSPCHGFISYPVGGMFWAKTSALRDLLEKKWTYDDFPQEPIPHDGTVLHAIERILVPVAQKNGCNEFVYHPETGSFTVDRGHLYKEYIGSIGDLGFIADNPLIKCVSFDVFDTLFYRYNSYPDQAKEALAEELGYGDSSQFLELRNGAEYALRQENGFLGDVSIVDVYDRLLPKLKTSLNSHQLADMEFRYDLASLLPKSCIIDALLRAYRNGKRILVCSDIYYTKAQIRKLLDTAGIPSDVDLFVSSDLKRRKDNGSMWVYVKDFLARSNIDPLAQFIHIGDNVVSDCQIAGDHGLSTYHILSPHEKWNAQHPVKVYESDMKDSLLRQKLGPLIALSGSAPFI